MEEIIQNICYVWYLHRIVSSEDNVVHIDQNCYGVIAIMFQKQGMISSGNNIFVRK